MCNFLPSKTIVSLPVKTENESQRSPIDVYSTNPRETGRGEAKQRRRLSRYEPPFKTMQIAFFTGILGVLACLDGYMNIALEQTEEYVNGQLKNKFGDAFIRGNNVLYISTQKRRY